MHIYQDQLREEYVIGIHQTTRVSWLQQSLLDVLSQPTVYPSLSRLQPFPPSGCSTPPSSPFHISSSSIFFTSSCHSLPCFTIYLTPSPPSWCSTPPSGYLASGCSPFLLMLCPFLNKGAGKSLQICITLLFITLPD